MTRPRPRPRLCIVQPVMKEYRVPFFHGLQAALQGAGIDLTVVYSRPWPAEALRGDNVALPPPLGHEVATHYLFNKLRVQPVWRPWWQADLVVVEQANKPLLNYLLIALRAAGLQRMAYWGHGRSMQADPAQPGERFKRLLLKRADWWFAYNDGAADYVAAQGYPRERITTVQNAVDTRQLQHWLAAVTPAEQQALRASLGWPDDAQVGLFCGSLYADKRVRMLIEQGDRLHAALPRFRLLVIGGGPEEAALRALAATRPWVHFTGPLFGAAQAAYLSIAHLWLNPGLVGLGALQAFCAGLPMLIQDLRISSPERSYIAHDVNALVLPDDADAYGDAVITLLRDDARRARLRQGALASAQRYSIETMVHNFTTGVTQCLDRS